MLVRSPSLHTRARRVKKSVDDFLRLELIQSKGGEEAKVIYMGVSVTVAVTVTVTGSMVTVTVVGVAVTVSVSVSVTV